MPNPRPTGRGVSYNGKTIVLRGLIRLGMLSLVEETKAHDGIQSVLPDLSGLYLRPLITEKLKMVGACS